MVIKTHQKRKTAPSTTKLRKTLWSAYFSPYIRLKEGYRCYTCGKQLQKKGSYAGHFVHRDCLDFDERNIHTQCYYCNVYQHGNRNKYAEKLEQQYGFGIIQELNKSGEAKKNWKVGELLLLIEGYKEKLKGVQENGEKRV
jgi:hypothetical protein